MNLQGYHLGTIYLNEHFSITNRKCQCDRKSHPHFIFSPSQEEHLQIWNGVPGSPINHGRLVRGVFGFTELLVLSERVKHR